MSKVIVDSQNGESATFIAKLSRTVKKNHIYAPMPPYTECNKLTSSVLRSLFKGACHINLFM